MGYEREVESGYGKEREENREEDQEGKKIRSGERR